MRAVLERHLKRLLSEYIRYYHAKYDKERHFLLQGGWRWMSLAQVCGCAMMRGYSPGANRSQLSEESQKPSGHCGSRQSPGERNGSLKRSGR